MADPSLALKLDCPTQASNPASSKGQSSNTIQCASCCLGLSPPTLHFLISSICFCCDKVFPALNYWHHNSNYDPPFISSRFAIYLTGSSSRLYKSLFFQLPVAPTVMNTVSLFYLDLVLTTLSVVHPRHH